MIRAYNKRQILRAIGHFVLCILATAVAYGFFYIAYFYAREAFDLEFPQRLNYLAPVSLVLLVYILGFIDLARGGGLRAYNESSLFIESDLNSGSGTVTQYYASQITSSAYFFSQICLSAPLQLMKAIRCSRSLLKDTPGLEEDLSRLLEIVRAEKKWHKAANYQADGPLLGYLINMDKVDFSPRKGVVRAV